jgi:23S rRNA pseudoU1915 N3-methylase RlmH
MRLNGTNVVLVVIINSTDHPDIAAEQNIRVWVMCELDIVYSLAWIVLCEALYRCFLTTVGLDP